jgi:hypothetical protein
MHTTVWALGSLAFVQSETEKSTIVLFTGAALLDIHQIEVDYSLEQRVYGLVSFHIASSLTLALGSCQDY